jgi:hypothetical protein
MVKVGYRLVARASIECSRGRFFRSPWNVLGGGFAYTQCIGRRWREAKLPSSDLDCRSRN